MHFAIGLSLLVLATLTAALASSTKFPLLQRQSNTTVSTPTPLLILPLGDSITFGYGSTTGNGYRFPLLSLLTSNPSNITSYNDTDTTFIGSIHNGNMTNNANEGHGGAVITEILKNGTNYLDTLDLYPNLILVMAGTNDMNMNLSVADAPARLGTLIDTLLSLCPDVTILVATLVPSMTEATEERAEVYNSEIPGVVQQRVQGGYRVGLVNMTAFVTVDELTDALHPNDAGYAKMAEAWYGGILEVEGKGWVMEPGQGTGTVDPIAGSTGTATTTTTGSSATATGKKNAGGRAATVDEGWAIGLWGVLVWGSSVAWLLLQVVM